MLFVSALAFLPGPLLGDDTEFCIAGTVVNALTGEPLRHAAVTIQQSAALTDAAGTFRFCGLRTGAYYAHAEKPGFGQAGVNVTVGPARDGVILRLQPAAVIRGKVVDGDGVPLENALVQLLSTSVEDGRRKVRVESSVTTDDRGEYRVGNLRPGRYFVRAAGWMPEPDVKEAFVPVYYGGATELASASPVKVEPGQELRADLAVALQTSYRIRGVLSGSSAALPAKIDLLRGDEELSTVPVQLDAGTGAFQVSHVVPGSYLIRATQGEGDQRMRGEQSLQVSNADVSGVVLPLAASVTLKGIVPMAAKSDATASSPNCSVKLSPAGALISADGALEGTTSEDGAFEVAGVLPGRYRLRMDCASGYISAARFGQIDLLAHDELVIEPGVSPPAIEAVLKTDGGTLSVVDGEPAPAWTILLPNTQSGLNARFAYVSGKFTFAGIAPGDYQLYAWTGSPYDFEYASPEARQAWAGRAVSVNVAERDHQTITLKVSAGEGP